MRIFAGPNGSGKSTVINEIRDVEIQNRPIDFGYYINADEITRELLTCYFDFKRYHIQVNREQILDFAKLSGLLDQTFSLIKLKNSLVVRKGRVYLQKPEVAERIGQLIARFLRQLMLEERRRFSFETVFSHNSNLEIMKEAIALGYKVYLYFVSTESPLINEYRVKLRVKQGGHPVPTEKIHSRYSRSLELMHEATQYCYQVFFFDNSGDKEPFTLVAHAKRSGDELVWDQDIKSVKVKWFQKYFVNKESFGAL